MTMGTFLISLVMVFIWTSLDHSVAGRKPASAYAKDQTEQVSQVDPALAMKDYQYSAVVPERDGELIATWPKYTGAVRSAHCLGAGSLLAAM